MTKRPPGVGEHTDEMQLPCIPTKRAKWYPICFPSPRGNTPLDISGCMKTEIIPMSLPEHACDIRDQ